MVLTQILVLAHKLSDQLCCPVSSDDIEPWMIWGYYVSPMMYGQTAIVMNEFLDKRWSTVWSSLSLSLFSLYISDILISISKAYAKIVYLFTSNKSSCFFSPIQTPDTMKPPLEEFCLIQGVSIRKTTGFGFASGHCLDFLSSSTFYL